jgi:hypothetical protein
LGVLYRWRKGDAGKVFAGMLQIAAWSKSSSMELSEGTARVSIAHTGCAAINEGKTRNRMEGFSQ